LRIFNFYLWTAANESVLSLFSFSSNSLFLIFLCILE